MSKQNTKFICWINPSHSIRQSVLNMPLVLETVLGYDSCFTECVTTFPTSLFTGFSRKLRIAIHKQITLKFAVNFVDINIQ